MLLGSNKKWSNMNSTLLTLLIPKIILKLVISKELRETLILNLSPLQSSIPLGKQSSILAKDP